MNKYLLSLGLAFALLTSCNDDEIQPLSSPPAVSAIAGEGQVSISWNDVEGALSYNIYWSISAGVTTANGTLILNAVSPHTHTGLTFGTTYYYIVVTVNEGGEGIPSGEVSATTRPSTPQNVVASPGEGEVTISWDNVSGATSYNIYWSQSTGVTPANGTLISNTVSPHIHTGLTFGTTFYYIVVAVNEAGEGIPSGEVSAQSTLPLPFEGTVWIVKTLTSAGCTDPLNNVTESITCDASNCITVVFSGGILTFTDIEAGVTITDTETYTVSGSSITFTASDGSTDTFTFTIVLDTLTLTGPGVNPGCTDTITLSAQ